MALHLTLFIMTHAKLLPLVAPQAYAVHHPAVPKWRRRVAEEALRAWAAWYHTLSAAAADPVPRHVLVPAIVQQVWPLVASDLVTNVGVDAWRRRLVELCAPKVKPNRAARRSTRGRGRSFGVLGR